MSTAQQRLPQQNPQQGSQQGSQQGTRQAAPAVSAGAGASNATRQDQQQGGVMGWLKGAGRWVGEKAGAAADAVKGWAKDTAQATREVWEAAASTDIGWKDGVITVETDLDEVMDVLPAGLKAGLQLDRAAADNRVVATLDTRTRELVLRSAHLQLAAIERPDLRTGPVTLRDVTLRFADHSGGLPFLGGDFSFLGYKDKGESLASSLSVGSADVSDVTWLGAGGPTTVSRLALTALSGQLSPGEGPELAVKIEGAVIEGLRGQGISVDSATLEGASAGLSASGESAQLEAARLALTGASQGGQTLGDAEVKGLRVDVDNRGGGALGLDGKADRPRARVAAEAASVRDFDGASADLAALSARGVQGSFDGTTGQGSLGAAALDAQGLDTAWVDAQALSLEGAQASLGGGSLGVDAQKARLKGLSVDPTAGGGGGAPLDWRTGVGQLDVDGARIGDVQAATLAATGLQASGRADGAKSTYTAAAATAGVSGLQHSALQATGLQGQGLRASGGAGGAKLQATGIQGQGLRSAHATVDALDAKGAAATLGRGGADATFAEGTLTGATVEGRLGVGQAKVKGLRAGAHGDRTSAQLEEADFTGIRDAITGAGAASARVEDLDYAGQIGGQHGATLGRGRVEGLAAGGVHARRAELGGLQVRGAADQLEAALASGHADGVEGHGHAADRLEVAGATAKIAGDARSAGASRLRGEGLSLGGGAARADVAAATALQVEAGAGGLKGTAGSAEAEGLRLQGQGLRASAEKVGGEGLSGEIDARGRASGAAERLTASGLDARVSGGGAGGPSGVDMARLSRTAAERVDDADLQLQAGLRAGELGGGLKAKRGTTASGRLSVRDNQLVPGQTGVRFNQALDGPLWTGVNGVDLRQDGKLMADVTGWFDQDVGGKLNGALGLPGERTPSVAQLGAAAGQAQGGGGPSPLTDLRAKGQVGFSAGQIDAGAAGGITLGDAKRAGDNTVKADVSGDQLKLAVDRLIATSARMQAGGAQVQTGAVTASGARATQKGGVTDAHVDQLDLRGVRAGRS
jgi:hypothetical protein